MKKIADVRTIHNIYIYRLRTFNSSMWGSLRLAPIIIIYLIITEGKWLNDLHIHAAQLLMKGVSDVSGLQYPVIGQNPSFAPTTAEMVQVLHSAGNHWLTLSTVGMKEDTV